MSVKERQNTLKNTYEREFEVEKEKLYVRSSMLSSKVYS